MRTILDWFAKHRFIRHNLIFFTGSMITAVLNYLYYPILGRMLSLSAFGDVQVLLSIFTQIAIFYGALGMATTNIAANTADEEKRNLVVGELKKVALLIMVGVSLLGLIFSGSIEAFLKLSDIRSLIVLIASLALTVPLTLGMAYLQGRQRFGELSLINIWAATAKLILGVALVSLGWAAFGAIAGLTIAQLTTWALVVSRLRRAGYYRVRDNRPYGINVAVIGPELKYAGVVLVVSLITTLLYSGDIIVIKHFFSQEQAGAYAGIATIGRIIYFVIAPIGVVMFSALKIDALPRENIRILAFSIALAGLLGGGILAIFNIAPQYVISTLLGSRYIAQAQLLPRLGLAIFLISIINLLFIYHLALRRLGVAVVALIGGLATLTLMVGSHGTMTDVIDNLTAGSLGCILILLAWKIMPRFKNIFERIRLESILNRK